MEISLENLYVDLGAKKVHGRLISQRLNAFKGRSQDFSRGTHNFPNPLASPPPPLEVLNLFLSSLI